jgi:hypothetical protein
MAREEGFFDELARGLADGSLTRGKALRLMGAALVGGTLGSLGIGEAAGDPPGCKRAGKHCARNDQCCGSLVCLSGTCQTPTTTTTETPTTTTTETPTTTTTETPTTTTTETPTTTTTSPPTSCTPGSNICASGVCGPVGSICSCVPTTEGQTACVVPSCGGGPCNSSVDCPGGSICVSVGGLCCSTNVCVTPCATTLASSSSAVRESSAWGSPQA